MSQGFYHGLVNGIMASCGNDLSVIMVVVTKYAPWLTLGGLGTSGCISLGSLGSLRESCGAQQGSLHWRDAHLHAHYDLVNSPPRRKSCASRACIVHTGHSI